MTSLPVAVLLLDAASAQSDLVRLSETTDLNVKSMANAHRVVDFPRVSAIFMHGFA